MIMERKEEKRREGTFKDGKHEGLNIG